VNQHSIDIGACLTFMWLLIQWRRRTFNVGQVLVLDTRNLPASRLFCVKNLRDSSTVLEITSSGTGVSTSIATLEGHVGGWEQALGRYRSTALYRYLRLSVIQYRRAEYTEEEEEMQRRPSACCQ